MCVFEWSVFACYLHFVHRWLLCYFLWPNCCWAGGLTPEGQTVHGAIFVCLFINGKLKNGPLIAFTHERNKR